MQASFFQQESRRMEIFTRMDTEGIRRCLCRRTKGAFRAQSVAGACVCVCACVGGHVVFVAMQPRQQREAPRRRRDSRAQDTCRSPASLSEPNGSSAKAVKPKFRGLFFLLAHPRLILGVVSALCAKNFP